MDAVHTNMLQKFFWNTAVMAAECQRNCCILATFTLLSAYAYRHRL